MQVRIGRNWLDSKDVPVQVTLTPDELSELNRLAAQAPHLPVSLAFNESIPVSREQVNLAS